MDRKKEQAVVVSQEMLADGIFSMWLRTEAAQTADKYLHEQGSAIEDPGTDEEAE